MAATIYRELLVPDTDDARITMALLDPRVLAWTENYETGVFSLDDRIHKATKWVWFQLNTEGVPGFTEQNLIIKLGVVYDDKTESYYPIPIIDEYGNSDCGYGNVPFKNTIAFEKVKTVNGITYECSAANTVEAKFPQNYKVPHMTPFTTYSEDFGEVES